VCPSFVRERCARVVESKGRRRRKIREREKIKIAREHFRTIRGLDGGREGGKEGIERFGEEKKVVRRNGLLALVVERVPTERVVDYFDTRRSQRSQRKTAKEEEKKEKKKKNDGSRGREDIDLAMKRAREASKTLQRKTEVLASARGEAGGGARKKKETAAKYAEEYLASRDEKENGAARKVKKTKALGQVEEKEEDTDADERNRHHSEKLFPAMTPRKPLQSARGRVKAGVIETGRKEEGDGKTRKVAKRKTTEATKTTATVSARESTKVCEKRTSRDVLVSAIRRLEKSFSSSKSSSREIISAAEQEGETALLLLEKPSSNEDSIGDAPVIIVDGKETMEAKVMRESMSANHALRFHKDRLEEEDVRDLDARVNDETNDFRVFYLPPSLSEPKTNKTVGSAGLNAIAAFAQNRLQTTKKKASSMKSTTSRTDSKGDYRARPGDHLAFRFEVKETLGSGTFGRVVKCVDHDVRSHDECTGQKRTVAIKIIKNKEEYRLQAKTEVAVLEAIESARIDLAEDHDKRVTVEVGEEKRARMKENADCVVRAIEHFNFRTHACIVFELLHCNLYEWMVEQRFAGASERMCKTVAKQLARALSFLKSLGIIHCDVKPENILLERRNGMTRQPNSLLKLPYPSTARAGSSSTQKYDAGNIRVKLIDFGSSCFANLPRIYPYVQSRFYRAPEVMLRDREYDQSIDMWSFACVLAELKRGSPIWPGTDEAEQLELAKETLGAPSSAFLYKLRREEELKKTSSSTTRDVDDQTRLTKDNTKTHDSHACASLSRVVPTTPMETKKNIKSRRLLAGHTEAPIETDVVDDDDDGDVNVLAEQEREDFLLATNADKNLETSQDDLASFEETARDQAKRRKLATEGLKKALGKGCSVKFAQFLQKCFEWDPEERLTPDEALVHSWLKVSPEGGPLASARY